MEPEWFRQRGYPHFDVPVTAEEAEIVSRPAAVASHSWLPLLAYDKVEKRYKPQENKTRLKVRPIMYASHKDSCILSKYAFELSNFLERKYQIDGLEKTVIAYRSLGRSNYHFAADAFRFALANSPCIVLCFDVSGFFDNLDHRFLKKRVHDLLGYAELPPDWYQVFRHVTRHRRILLTDIATHPVFGPRLKEHRRRRSKPHRTSSRSIATIADIKLAGITILKNEKSRGIPQGTPISSILSNLYLLDFDKTLQAECCTRGALYQRYSDDILIICSPANEADLREIVSKAMAAERLETKEAKTTRTEFHSDNREFFQYLGFDIDNQKAVIRGSSLSRQWRKAKHSLKITKEIGMREICAGNASKIHTKRLRKRFQPVGARNFSSYTNLRAI